MSPSYINTFLDHILFNVGFSTPPLHTRTENLERDPGDSIVDSPTDLGYTEV